jgi:hypothetical protein
MAYSSEKTMNQALRRIKSDEKQIKLALSTVKDIDIELLMRLSEHDISTLMTFLPKLQKMNDKLQLAKSKGLEYKREEPISQPINAKLLDRLKTKYSTATQISMKSTHTKEEFKKELVKRCANSLIGYVSCVNYTLDAFYDSIDVPLTVIETVKKPKKPNPKAIDDTQSVFNNIMTRE